MLRPALSDRYVVAPAGPGRRACLAFRSLDSQLAGFYRIGGVGGACCPGLLPMLRLAAPMERLPDLDSTKA